MTEKYKPCTREFFHTMRVIPNRPGFESRKLFRSGSSGFSHAGTIQIWVEWVLACWSNADLGRVGAVREKDTNRWNAYPKYALRPMMMSTTPPAIWACEPKCAPSRRPMKSIARQHAKVAMPIMPP